MFYSLAKNQIRERYCPTHRAFSLEKPKIKKVSSNFVVPLPQHGITEYKNERLRSARPTRGLAGRRAPRGIRTASLLVVPEKAHRPLDSSRSSGFRGARPRVEPPRLRGPDPRIPSVPAHRTMPPAVATSTRAEAPAARKDDAPKRKRELNARVVRPPRRPARHSRSRARAARRPAASSDRTVLSSPSVSAVSRRSRARFTAHVSSF